jgi:molecular chaperone DnaK
MGYGLGVDLGVTFAAAAVRRAGGVEMVSLGDRAVAVPSVLLVREDGVLVSGEAAERRAAGAPGRVARQVKRRLGDPTPVVLAGVGYPPAALLAAQLSDILAAVTAVEGGPPAEVVLTHPAVWGPYRRAQFADVPRLAGLDRVRMVTEPEAAAAHYTATRALSPGEIVAVYDLGGGTFDTTVLRAHPDRVDILGHPEGVEDLGGIDFDQAILDHLDHTLAGALSALDPTHPDTAALLTQLRRDTTLAKETLSTDTHTTIPIYLPGAHTSIDLSRAQLETLIRPLLAPTLHAVHRALHSAGLTPADLTAILLVGGSTKIPLIPHLLAHEFHRPIRTDHPKHAVALGAARLTTAATTTGTTHTETTRRGATAAGMSQATRRPAKARHRHRSRRSRTAAAAALALGTAALAAGGAGIAALSGMNGDRRPPGSEAAPLPPPPSTSDPATRSPATTAPPRTTAPAPGSAGPLTPSARPAATQHAFGGASPGKSSAAAPVKATPAATGGTASGTPTSEPTDCPPSGGPGDGGPPGGGGLP